MVATRSNSHRKSLLSSDPVFSQQPDAQAPQSYDPTDHHGEPVYPQPSYMAPAYSENATTDPTNYDQGYAQREGVAPSIPASKPRESFFAFMSSKWAAMFMGVTAIQAVVCLCFESYIFATFQTSLRDIDGRNLAELDAQYKTIPTFLTLFIFGFLYELVVVWDALRMKNTIQVIGVCFSNLALVVYTAIQVDQISMALDVLEYYNSLKQGYTIEGVWEDIRPYLIAIPTVIALVTVCMIFITWKLYQEFAWDILKTIGADYRMKKRFLHYQIYIALLKFDFFFFLGFIIQLVVIVTKTSDPEFALTIVTIPVTIIILICAAYFTRMENKPGMVGVLILYFGGLSYFIFKLVRIWTWRKYYETVQKSLTTFSVITILLIILTIANCIVCMRNFDSGLKSHLLASKKDEESADLNSVSLNDVKPQPSRMTID